MLTLSAEKAELKSFYDEVSYMSVRIKNMTDGKPAALIFTFALPLMIGNVFQQLYTVVDTMVVGKGLGVIAGVINPEIFVIGGGVSKAGEILFDYIKPPYERTAFHGSKDAKFALATLGNDAGIYGAAKMVLD